MYVIVVGGGKVGYYLAKTLLTEGHEVAVIEKDPARCRKIERDIGDILVIGDGSTPDGLERAGASRAGVVAAVTGQDETNLVACQVAKTFFQVSRTIARVNNPKNEALFHALGAGIAVSSTQRITDLIQREVDTRKLQNLLTFEAGEVNLVEVDLPPNAPVAGHKLADLRLPQGSLLVAVMRSGRLIIPDGRTQLLGGDRLIAVSQSDREADLTRLLLGEGD
jgi:trk system potassium uptake protein TrkA